MTAPPKYVYGKWEDAFCKFGYDDGEGKVHTEQIANVLRDNGYSVKTEKWCAHNKIIYSIHKGGIEFVDLNIKKAHHAYVNPRFYLSSEILEILDIAFG